MRQKILQNICKGWIKKNTHNYIHSMDKCTL